ncbi:O-methyltransferase [Paenibacillus senegalensis]|uniref:O-methyltransferase n=1 Tax=Paenibacillus senegalensis TaxID=1465766 RepID=UPI0037095AB2
MLTSMDEKQYAESLLPVDPQLEQVRTSIRDQQMHDISVPAGYGKLLTLLVRMTGAKAVLEIGALGGYSGICLARGLADGGRLTSLELREDYIQLAKNNVSRAGFGECVEYRAGEALESLKQLYAEGRRFDFFFIDADKGNYPNYLDWALKLALPGAVIAGDNAFMKGKVYQDQYEGNSVKAMRTFNQRMLNDERLEGVLLPAYDGLAVARVKAGS